MTKMERLRELAALLREACQREDAARLRAHEWRARRIKIAAKIDAEFEDPMQAYEFHLLLKEQAGVQADNDFHALVDYEPDQIIPMTARKPKGSA